MSSDFDGHEPAAPQYAADGESLEMDKDARLWGALAHLAALSMFFTGVGFVLGPFIVWMLKRNDYPFVDWHGKESLNFQASVFLYGVALGVLTFLTCGLGGFLAVPAAIVLGVADVVFVILASIAANDGRWYRYPLTIRILK